MKHLEMERSGAASRRRASARAAEPSEARRFRPVMLWAAIGVGALVLQIVAFTGWVVSGDFKATPPGPTPVPGWMHVTIRSWEVLSVPASLLILYFFLIRPWRRHGHITLDGMFCLAAFTIFWQDTFINFFQVQVVYNSGFVNRGSWYPHVLGWLSPNTNRISTSLIGFAPGGYLYFWFGMMVVGCWIMRKVKQRWPQLGTFGLNMTCLAFFLAFHAVAEALLMPLRVPP